MAVLGGHRHDQQRGNDKAARHHLMGVPAIHQPAGHQNAKGAAEGEQRGQDRRLLQLIAQSLHQDRHPAQQHVINYQPHKVGQPQHQRAGQIRPGEQQADAGFRLCQFLFIQIETRDVIEILADKALGNAFDFDRVFAAVNHVLHRFRQEQDQQYRQHQRSDRSQQQYAVPAIGRDQP
ncbi:hypothetical protein D3C78_1261390 [compost metagenome]